MFDKWLEIRPPTLSNKRVGFLGGAGRPLGGMQMVENSTLKINKIEIRCGRLWRWNFSLKCFKVSIKFSFCCFSHIYRVFTPATNATKLQEHGRMCDCTLVQKYCPREKKCLSWGDGRIVMRLGMLKFYLERYINASKFIFTLSRIAN